MSLIKGIHHVSMKCAGEKEYEKTIHFYRDLLELPVARTWAAGTMFMAGNRTGSSLIEIFNDADSQLEKGVIRHFAFAVDDVDACVAAVRAEGYEVFIEPKDIEIPSDPAFPAKIAFCKGPLGEEIEFFCEKNHDISEHTKDEAFEWELKDVLYNSDRMAHRVEKYAQKFGLEQTLISLPLMRQYHAGQVRKGKDKAPYEVHPLTMACHVIAMDLMDDDLIATCLLHDVIEDCDVTIEQLGELGINSTVQEAVLLLTKDGKTKKEYYDDISKNGIASVSKLLDRCNNVSGMSAAFPKSKLAKYIVETEKYVMPLVKVLREEHPEYSNAAFLLKYQMGSVLETVKHII